jgi:hypothetical protein
VGQNHDEAISNLLAEREVTRLNDILVWLMKLQNNTNQRFAVIAHHGPMSLETKRLNNYDRPVRALALNVFVRRQKALSVWIRAFVFGLFSEEILVSGAGFEPATR